MIVLIKKFVQSLHHWRERGSVELLLLIGGLCTIAIFLAVLDYLPFQDVPAHVHLFALDGSVAEAEAGYLARPPRISFSYNLYLWLYRLFGFAVSASVMVRICIILAAVALPLSLVYLARVTSMPMALSGLLALPIALSWSLKMGFVPFALGIPLVFLTVALAIGACQKETLPRYLALAVAVVLCYCAHALAYAVGGLAVGVVWLALGKGRFKIALKLISALFAALPFLIADFLAGAFAPAADRFDIIPASPLFFRPVQQAIAQLATKTYGIAGIDELWWFIPLIALLVIGTVGALRQLRQKSHPGFKPLFYLAGGALVVTLAVPEAMQLLYYLGSRLAVFFVGFSTVLAAAFWAKSTRWQRGLVAGGVGLALACQLLSVAKREAVVSEILGLENAPVLRGKYLTAHLADCPGYGNSWGDYDPVRHLWAYTLVPHEGITPYLFAWNGYHPIRYNAARLGHDMRAPSEHINSNGHHGKAGCRKANLMRLRGATQWPGYDGAIIMGRPTILNKVMEQAEIKSRRRLRPGIVLVNPRTEDSSSVKLELGTYAAAANLGSGWSFEEYFAGSWRRWALGHRSQLRFTLDVSAPTYELVFSASPHKDTVPQTLIIELNGRSIVTIQMGVQWGDYRIKVPAGLFKPGMNTMTLNHSKSVKSGEPSDRLSACYAQFQLVPLDPQMATM